MRVSPLRLELTVPAQYVTAVAVGSAVNLEVDAYPGETFVGQVRYVSPALRADTRALIVEAIVANADGRLKPGPLRDSAHRAGGQVAGAARFPRPAVQKTATANRVFVVVGDHVEERLITIGQADGDRIEATSGLRAGDRVVVGGLERLKDGALVKVGS